MLIGEIKGALRFGSAPFVTASNEQSVYFL